MKAPYLILFSAVITEVTQTRQFIYLKKETDLAHSSRSWQTED